MRKVNEMVQNVLNQEVIQSPWASPIVLVAKKMAQQVGLSNTTVLAIYHDIK